MKKRHGFHLLTLACLLSSTSYVPAAVSYWDPSGFRGSYNTYAGNSLTGSWDTNGWARNTGGTTGLPADQGMLISQLQPWTDGDAAVFAVGAGATNNVNQGGANTTTFTVTMNANHTIAGIFDGSLNNKSCKVTIDGAGVLTLTNGFDAFNITTNATDGSLGVVTVNVVLAGPGILTAENSGGQIFLNGANTWTGGTQIGFSNVTAFTGTLNFTNNNAFGSGPIVIITGNSATTCGTLQCTNPGVVIPNAVDFSQALSATPFLNIVGNAGGVVSSGQWVCGTNTANVGSSGAAANIVNISGPISGTAGIGKFGAGTLVLSGANTYSGGTTISAGTLQVGNGGASGGLGSGAIANNAALTFMRSGTVTVSDVISGAGSLTQAGSGTLVLSGANGYSGITTVSAGTLQLGAVSGIPSGSPVKISGGATLDLNGFGPTLTSLAGAGNVINNNGTLTLEGNLTTAGVNTTYSCISGSIGGSGTLDKQGSHTMALRGTSTFSGGLVQLEAGTLSVGAGPNRLPTGSTLLMFGGTFQLDAENQTFAGLSGSGNINLGGGTLTINQSGSSTFSGVIQNSDLPGSSTASGNGLRGYYYDNEDMTNLKAVRDDANVNFANLTVTNATIGLPNAGIATNTFSVRWLGRVLTTGSAGNYVFTTTTDDGARLWVNGTLVVDSWIDQGATARSGSITLAANTLYDIVMEYYQNGVAASAVLSWSPPGSGATNAIPSSNLFLPGAGTLAKTGSGSLTLSGVNTYTGPTIVGAGTLEISSTNGLASSSVTVTNGGTLKLDSATALSSQTSLILNTNTGSPTVNLNFSGTASIGSLSLDGGATTAASGTWGSPTSGAQHTSSRFTGIGLLNPGVCSSTNVIVGVTNAGNRTLTLTMRGSVGAQYYVVTHTNILQPFASWQPVAGSTNVVSAGNGLWSLSISNPAPTGFYRVKALQPCP